MGDPQSESRNETKAKKPPRWANVRVGDTVVFRPHDDTRTCTAVVQGVDDTGAALLHLHGPDGAAGIRHSKYGAKAGQWFTVDDAEYIKAKRDEAGARQAEAARLAREAAGDIDLD